MRRLFFYVSRFRDAIEADLAFRGISFGRLWRLRQWRKLLNLIQNLPPNSLFNEALWNDKETVVAMTAAMKDRQEEDERPPGPRISQVSEEARRLGEVVSLVRWLGGVILTSSPKFKGGKIPKVEPYTQPVRIDGETGLWRGQRTPDEQRASHQHRVDLVKQAGERYRALQNK